MKLGGEIMKLLVQLRVAKGWSQTKLAEASGVSQTYISDLEAGKKNPTVLILQKLAKALEVPISQLLDEKTAI